MSAYWIKFDGHQSSCVEADTEQEAKHIASDLTGKTVTACAVIPYPAQPRLNKVEHPQWGITPSFCFDPESCKGRTSCPQRYSCTE